MEGNPIECWGQLAMADLLGPNVQRQYCDGICWSSSRQRAGQVTLGQRFYFGFVPCNWAAAMGLNRDLLIGS
jgi:hypothetical protein